MTRAKPPKPPVSKAKAIEIRYKKKMSDLQKKLEELEAENVALGGSQLGDYESQGISDAGSIDTQELLKSDASFS